MKTCSRCHATKPLAEFPMQREKGRTYPHSRCRECRREQCRAWSKTQRGKDVKRQGILRRDFRMTESDYLAMHARQGGLCAICRRPETKVHRDGRYCRLAVDHSHSTGAVRALLCSGCNVGLGSFEDDPERLRAAADYLARF